MCHSGRIVRSLVDPGWHFQVAKTFRGQTPASTTCIVPIHPCQVDLKHRQLEPQAQRDIDTAMVTYVFSMSTQAYMPPHMNMCGDVGHVLFLFILKAWGWSALPTLDLWEACTSGLQICQPEAQANCSVLASWTGLAPVSSPRSSRRLWSNNFAQISAHLDARNTKVFGGFFRRWEPGLWEMTNVMQQKGLPED